MKVSRNWLQKYFENPLPEAEVIGDALTFHSFEMEEIKGDLLDINVLPDRACYALSHRGIALEVGAALGIPLAHDPLREVLPEEEATDELAVTIENPEKCMRYMGAVVRGVRVGPSPAWLREALESVGQRSINNIVDATNYVMLNIGQPLHAFDAGKLSSANGTYAIMVRGAKADEKITTLTGEEYVLPEGTLLITDTGNSAPIGIAGVKGGMLAKVTEETTDLVIESASFDGSSVRRAAQSLKLFTDASTRYQNKPSSELTAYGIRDVLALIQEVAGGKVIGTVDEYPTKVTNPSVVVSLVQINAVLGTDYDAMQVQGVFDTLGFSYTEQRGTFTVVAPFERRDITIPEDVIEEVGRIIGYEHIESKQLPPLSEAPDQARFRGIERIKDVLAGLGYTELSTQTFAAEGDILLANPLDQSKPALRTTLADGMRESLAKAVTVAPRVLGPAPMLKLFEVGTVFKGDHEELALAVGYKQLSGKRSAALLPELCQILGEQFSLATTIVDEDIITAELSSIDLTALGKDYAPRTITLGMFRPFSIYPFALRDIAVWTSREGVNGLPTEQSEVEDIILKEAGDLLVRIDLFDRFEKEVDGIAKISYAFRLVFQSDERTLSDSDLDPLMERVTNALNANEGWEVR